MSYLHTLLVRPGKIIILSCLLILTSSAQDNTSKNPQSAKNNILQQKKGLLGVCLDLANGKLTDWNHKNNSKLSILEDSGKKVLHFESRFEPYTFTWTTHPFAPTAVEGVAHVRFRLRSDASGHKLHVTLGTQRPGEQHPLYYQNTKQTVLLDSNGWRSVSVDIDQFDTPAGGLREQDFTHVIFIQFMVTVSDIKKPLDIALDKIEFTGRTEAELAAIEKRRQEREQTITELQPELTQTRKDLGRIRDQLDALASQNKYVNIARAYWTALEWCANDIQRCLQAEELEIVQQARPLLTDLKKRLEVPDQILKHVLDNPPHEDDPFYSNQNPYFRSLINIAEVMSRRETVYVKGHKGYLSVSNAWSFASFGNALFDAAWAMTTPQSKLRHHSTLLVNALDLLDTIAHQHTEGDFNINRTAIYGRDENINRFCLAPTLDAWHLLRKSYPDLLPPAKQADIESGLKQLAEFQRKTYGLARLERDAHEKFPAYPNMDVHHILIMEFAHRFWGDPEYARERDAFVKILDSAVFPMGAFTYINTQNECFVYHHLDVVYSARYWKLSGNPITLAMLRRTIPFYPYNVEPAGMPEYYTDACWKHYWGGGQPDGPDVIASLFDDPLNKRVAEICGEIWKYGHGYMSAITAEFWKPQSSKPLPDGYLINDTNIDGPRGRYGTWSFAGNGRNYGVGYQGKDTFVGAMITDPTNRPMPLDSALQVVTTEVRLNNIDNHWKGGRCCSALEKLTTTCGADFGSLAVRYAVSKPNWHHKNDDLLPWDGTQEWYLSKTRLAGLVALEATSNETAAAVHGRIRLGLSRTLENSDNQAWKYGRLRIKIHAHNYARIDTRPSETFYLDKPEKYRSKEITLLDPLSAGVDQKGKVNYPKGTRYWFLVEIYPDSSEPATELLKIEEGPLAGLILRESDRQVLVLHNPTDSPVTANLSRLISGNAATIYEDASGKGKPVDPLPAEYSLGPQRHIVIVAKP